MADMDPRTGKLEWVSIQCPCGYSVTWNRAAILARAGPYRRPMDFARSLRCSICGAKGTARVNGGKR